jgi:hypothetical protein
VAYSVKDVRVGRIVEHASVDGSSPNVRVLGVIKNGNLGVGATRINGANCAIVVQDDKNPIHVRPGQVVRCGWVRALVRVLTRVGCLVRRPEVPRARQRIVSQASLANGWARLLARWQNGSSRQQPEQSDCQGRAEG